jgi:DNA-binding IscR family transcriptional regulator
MRVNSKENETVDTHMAGLFEEMICAMQDMRGNGWMAYLTIVSFTDLQSGNSCIPIHDIAHYMGVSRSTAERAVKSIIEKGYVQRVSVNGRRSGTFSLTNKCSIEVFRLLDGRIRGCPKQDTRRIL